jgi:hypothetical protein
MHRTGSKQLGLQGKAVYPSVWCSVSVSLDVSRPRRLTRKRVQSEAGLPVLATRAGWMLSDEDKVMTS